MKRWNDDNKKTLLSLFLPWPQVFAKNCVFFTNLGANSLQGENNQLKLSIGNPIYEFFAGNIGPDFKETKMDVDGKSWNETIAEENSKTPFHSSEIRGLRSTKCSSEMLQNLLCFMYKKTHVVLFVFHFVQLYIFTL